MSQTIKARTAMVLSVLVLVGGLVFAGASLANKTSDRAVAPQSLVIHYVHSALNSAGALEPVGYYVRAVNSSGVWKETRYSFNGSNKSVVASDEDGLYVRNGDAGSKHLYAQTDPQARTRSRTAADYLNDPQFVRSETLLGRTVYVLRVGEGDQYSELSFALEVGGGNTVPLRIVGFAGGQTMIRIDPIAIEVRDLSEAEVRLPADLPIKTDLFQKRAQERLSKPPRQK